MTLTGSGDLGGASAAARRLIESVGTITPAQAVLPAAEGFTFVQVPPASPSASGSKVSLQAIITTARASDRSTARDKILQGLEALHFAGVRVEPVYYEPIVPGVTNAPELAARASKRIGEALGAGAVTSITSVVPAFSEDFGFFQDQVPGVFCFLGVSNVQKGWTGMPHSPDYVADEGSILVGARAMTAAIIDHLFNR